MRLRRFKLPSPNPLVVLLTEPADPALLFSLLFELLLPGLDRHCTVTFIYLGLNAVTFEMRGLSIIYNIFLKSTLFSRSFS